MRKLILQMQITLDGFVAGPNGENDWVFIPGQQDAEALKFSTDMADSCDTLLAGRKLSHGWMDHWQNIADNQPDSPWNAFAKLMVKHRKIAFSKTPGETAGRDFELENRDLATVIKELKNEPGKDLLVYGGVDFASSLIEHDLIDEYYFVLNTVAIGKGLSIFKERKIMKLEKSVAYANGKVLNKYVRA